MADSPAKTRLRCNPVPTCGCGCPDEIMALTLRVLRAYAKLPDGPSLIADGDEDYPPMLGDVPDNPLGWAFLSYLDELGWTEHGVSIRVGWLTDVGKQVLDDLEEAGTEIEGWDP